jgi:hypothetical protein
MKTKPPNPADMFIFYLNKDLFEGVAENDPCCGKTEGSYTTKFKKGSSDHYTDYSKGQVSINYRPSERDFSLGFDFSTGKFKPIFRRIYEVSETNCPLYTIPDLEPISPQRTHSFADRLEDGRYGQRAVGSAGEVLYGSKVFDLEDKTKITWKWNLYRCRD